MSLLLFAAAAVQVPLSVPVITVDRCGEQINLEGEVTTLGPDGLIAKYNRPAPDVLVVIDDRTTSALAVSVPTIAYDQPLALLNARTGLVTEYPEIVQHHRPDSVVADVQNGAITSTATDAYIVSESEPLVAHINTDC